MKNNLDLLLQIKADNLANKTAIKTYDDRSQLSYRDLDYRASVFAKVLKEHGCRPGDTIILGFCNTPDFFVALFGCFRGGFIATPVDASLAASELKIITDHAEPSAIVVDYKSQTIFSSLDRKCEILTISGKDSSFLSLMSITEHKQIIQQSEKNISPETSAMLLYTSGTTGDPKGVLYTHGNIIEKLSAISKHFSFDESFKTLCLLPTHFGHGLICNCLPVFFYGGTLVLTPPFNLELIRDLWQVIKDKEINNFSSVPAVLRLLAQYSKYQETKIENSLKFITCASAPLWPDEIEKFQETFGIPILNCYGLTEAAGWIACSKNDPNRNLASVGKAINGNIRVVDKNGHNLPSDKIGEIQVKGPSVMTAYYKYDNSNHQITDDGWLSTGDLGELDDFGNVFLRSRTKEIIIRAGKNIFPAEIDKTLMSHPDVVDACTVGLDDTLMGEKVAACIVLRENSNIKENDILTHVQKSLAAFKCPQKILFVPQIPKTSRGKVNRSKLKPLFAN